MRISDWSSDVCSSDLRLGNVAVAIQPARGYHIDPKASYHDPDLAPPHGYLAFHAWLRRTFDAHAVVFVGKNGNLEWLPGKALALSGSCFPEAIGIATCRERVCQVRVDLGGRSIIITKKTYL